MLLGVPKEIKNHEYRVGLTPESVAEVVAHGHAVLSEGAMIKVGWAAEDCRALDA